MTNKVEVTTIIPTMAEERRHRSLLRAIDSIASSSANAVSVVVVVNGDRRSSSVLESLSKLTHVRVLSVVVGSLPLAILEGRRLVDTPYFSFLDDDDEYLPGAIDLRLESLKDDAEIDFVVSNGYRNVSGQDAICFSNLDRVASSPLENLFVENWLASCGSMFRSRSVTVEFFEDPHPYVEWTWLAFKLCLANKRLATIGAPTFRIHDTPGSESKSPAYSRSVFDLHQRMLGQTLPSHIRALVRERIGASLHDDADSFRKQGRLAEAWEAHIKSLFCPRGWRYLPFSGRLLFPFNK